MVHHQIVSEGGDQYAGGPASHISMNMLSSSNGTAAANASAAASSAPRMHPKKRKYDPTEAEQFATDLSTQSQNAPDPKGCSAGGSGISGSVTTAGRSGEVMMCPTTATESVPLSLMNTTTDTSIAMADEDAHARLRSGRTIPELDLRDWCETRVLAKYKRGESVYVQGVIKSSDSASDLVVEFEGPEGCVRQTYDVINSNRLDIIADASPSISDVSHSQYDRPAIAIQW